MLSLPSGTASGEFSVVFQTEFTELPDDWSSTDKWGFNPHGVHLSAFINYENHLYEVMQSVPVARYFVQDGADSLVVDMEHSITVGSTEGIVSVRLHTGNMGSFSIFQVNVSQEGYSSCEPVHYVVLNPPQGTYIGFRFLADVEACYPESGTINWHITSLSAVAYGEGMAMNPVTWGSVKPRFTSSVLRWPPGPAGGLSERYCPGRGNPSQAPGNSGCREQRGVIPGH